MDNVRGMTVPARLSIVTIGVTDLARSVAFYEALGWERCASSQDAISWFRMTGSYIGLFPYDELAKDAAIASPQKGSFGGITLAMNVGTEAAVDAALQAAEKAGASLLKPAEHAEWGGYSGYFADPDGTPWEVAYNPHFPLDAEGRVTIP
jgi:catechol 2,3-dioxygenase-like lactoylglutathione lyase family enzyme